MLHEPLGIRIFTTLSEQTDQISLQNKSVHSLKTDLTTEQALT